MPVFKRYKISAYKEVMSEIPSGLVSDGGLSTWTLNDNIGGPFGTSDFLGVARVITLIGDVVEITMDTRALSVNQINNMTQAEFDRLVGNNTIRISERSLGWAEISKTRSSLYYEECLPTNVQFGSVSANGQTLIQKRAVSEHYYDFSTFGFGNRLVVGSSPADIDNQYSIYGEQALVQVGSFDPNIGNNMGVFGPGFNQLDLQSYMRMVINSTISTGNGFIQNTRGETRPVVSWQPLDGDILNSIPLYLATYEEHFDNENAPQIISPIMVSTGRYGRLRDTIQEGFRASNYPPDANLFINVGRCQSTRIPSPVSERGGGGVLPTGGGSEDDGTGNQGGRGPGGRVVSVLDDATFTPPDRGKIINQGPLVRRDVDDMCIKIIHDFPISLKERMTFSRNVVPILEIYSELMKGQSTTINPPFPYYGYHSARILYYIMKLFRGEVPYITSQLPDILDTPTLPRGTIRKEINPETGCIELTYIGTPVGDYVGPKIIGPEEFEPDPNDGEPIPLVRSSLNRLTGTSRQPLPNETGFSKLRKTVDWRRRFLDGRSSLITQIENNSRTGGSISDFNQYLEIVEEVVPVFFSASDQIWDGSTNETKFIYLANFGGTRIIVTDYRVRGNANFINVSLLDALPLVINPGESVRFAVDYVRTTEGLQQWKGKYDPFPALGTNTYPYDYIVMEYDVYAEVPYLGYMPIDEIPETSSSRIKGKFSKSNRNKLFSVLKVNNPAGKNIVNGK
jgi:hypothetical protein